MRLRVANKVSRRVNAALRVTAVAGDHGSVEYHAPLRTIRKMYRLSTWDRASAKLWSLWPRTRVR